MKKHISKNYFYNSDTKSLYRIISDNKHLLWRPEYAGVACFNKALYEEYKDRCEKIGWIVRIEGKPFYRYSMPIWGECGFNAWKILLEDVEPQYLVFPLSAWEVKEIK